MALKTNESISLDFYTQSVTIVQTKQYDTESRYINITCTEHGKKVFLDNGLMSAFIRYKKSDGTFIFNDTEILSDGTILVNITQQMTSVKGRHVVDLLITSLNGISANQLIDMNTIYDMGATVISTMQFYLNVTGSTLDEELVTSTSEYSALLNSIARLARTEKDMSDLNELLNSQESERQQAELKRQDDITGEAYRKANEQARQNAESLRETNVSNTIQECNDRIDATITESNKKINQAVEKANIATSNANTVTSNANTAISNANKATSDAKAATEECISATASANSAVQEFETIKDQSGIIMQTEKGVANGIATLDSNTKIPESQLPFTIVNNLTTTTSGSVLDARIGKTLNTSIDELSTLLSQLQNQVNEIHKIHYGTEEPNNSVGNNGDIYLKIIV